MEINWWYAIWRMWSTCFKFMTSKPVNSSGGSLSRLALWPIQQEGVRTLRFSSTSPVSCPLGLFIGVIWALPTGKSRPFVRLVRTFSTAPCLKQNRYEQPAVYANEVIVLVRKSYLLYINALPLKAYHTWKYLYSFLWGISWSLWCTHKLFRKWGGYSAQDSLKRIY